MNPLPLADSRRRPALEWGALAIVLAVAAVLRFTALDWGLRHQPEHDERVFVENAARMASRGTLDHEYYYYPGFVFDLLAPMLALRATPFHPDPGAYVLARRLMAAMSVGSVAVLYLLGRSRVGVAAGLSAALFLAVSPVDVFVPHKMRPDAMLGTFSLLVLWALGSLGRSRRADALAGVALGAANAVKFSGVLLLPSVLLSWLLSPQRRWSSLAVLGACAAVTFLGLTPYALLNFRTFAGGALVQFGIHYRQDVVPYSDMLVVYLVIVVKSFGLAAGLALLALPAAARDWRRWAPLIAFPVTAVLTFATSDVRHERFVAPCLGVVALLAGSLVQRVARRHTLAAVALALAAAAFPFKDSLVLIRDLSRPGTMDRVVDWTLESVPPGKRLLTLVPELGLDAKRFEVLRWAGPPRLQGGWLALAPYVARQADYIVVDVGNPKQAVAVVGLEPAMRAPAESNVAGPSLAVFRVPDSGRPRYVRLPAAEVVVSASENEGDVTRLRDGLPETAWMSVGEQRPGQWIEATWRDPVLLARLVLDLGSQPPKWGRQLKIAVTVDGKDWKPVWAALASGPVDEADPASGPTRQVLVLRPVCVRGVRVLQEGRSERRWAVAELGLDALAAHEPCAPTP